MGGKLPGTSPHPKKNIVRFGKKCFKSPAEFFHLRFDPESGSGGNAFGQIAEIRQKRRQTIRPRFQNRHWQPFAERGQDECAAPPEGVRFRLPEQRTGKYDIRLRKLRSQPMQFHRVVVLIPSCDDQTPILRLKLSEGLNQTGGTFFRMKPSQKKQFFFPVHGREGELSGGRSMPFGIVTIRFPG